MIEPTLEPTNEDVKAAIIWLDDNNHKFDDIALVARTECAKRQLREALAAPDAVEIPNLDWARMAEVAADDLCTPEEHPAHEVCMACLAIKGTRWALEMRKQLEAAKQRADEAFNEGVEAAVNIIEFYYDQNKQVMLAAVRELKRPSKGDQA